MLNKSLSFSLVAAAIIIAPTTAIAQDQYTEQRIYQNGAAIDGSTSVQEAEIRSTQEQIQINRDGRDRYNRRNRDYDRDRYYRRNRNDDRDRYYRRNRDYDDDYYYYGR